MIRKFKKEESGGVLILTLIVIFLLEVLVLSLMPMSVTQYKAVLNYRDYTKLEYLAKGALDEVIWILEDNWDTNAESAWHEEKHAGMYKYKIDKSGDLSKKITITVKNDSIQRTYSCKIVRRYYEKNLTKLADYPVYSSKDLKVACLDRINSNSTEYPLGTGKNLYIENIQNPNGLNLAVNGNIYINSGNVQSFIEGYPVVDSLLPIYDIYGINQFIALLKSKFDGKIKTEGNLHFFTLETLNFDKGQEVMFIEASQKVTIRDINFKGLLIISGVSTLEISNAGLDGMLIVLGPGSVSARNFTVNGSVSFLGCEIKDPLDIKVNHDREALSPYEVYLSEDLGGKASSFYGLDVLEYKEVE
ncbi:pilus assembly PilX N-terminal domain-containing protein [Alkalibacter saccharofermentans]|uniref:pilus assembly PilX N-terminal domain-containing protein n=1 Tax=Alkalibacter saccharofermentans TaxID=235931 RepID=UPI0009345BF7|nr:pilus assembly PilX N-terminal domain-containing protein [Alkalibacter saccharofermentans]